MLNSNIGSTDFYLNNGTRPKQYHRDTETLMRWLACRVPIENEESTNDLMPILNLDVINDEVCYLKKNASSMSCPNVCVNVRSKREAVYFRDLPFDEHWLKDTVNKLRFQC